MPLRHEGHRILARAELDDVSGCRVACRQAIPLYEEGRIDRLLRDRTRASERILRSGGN